MRMGVGKAMGLELRLRLGMASEQQASGIRDLTGNGLAGNE